MNRKAIKSILRCKINSWLESIEDESVKKLAQENQSQESRKEVSALKPAGSGSRSLVYLSKPQQRIGHERTK